ncbi:transporter [Streptomyces sp. NPDC048639]|uniref:transporter n=1 Tax=Streptomyces sp. NPDC048639 TaxID=3365581 RepID=UPI00371D8634
MKGSFWLAWRQQRALIIGSAGVLAVLAVVAASERAAILSALGSGAVRNCGIGPLTCRNSIGLPRALDTGPLRLLGILNMALPVLIGMLWGAPLLGRDRELGTHRLVLTQGVSRTRWFAARLMLAATWAVVVAGVPALLFAWWWKPVADRSYGLYWYETVALEGSGPRAVAAAVLGLAVGTLAGLLVRRVVLAMGLTALVTGTVGVLLQWSHQARLLVPPQVYASHGAGRRQPMADKWSAGNWGYLTPSGHRESITNCPYPAGRELRECMTDHDYASRVYSANPPGDYWVFQWIDTAVLCGLAIALVAFTVWRLRRRI